MDDLVVANTLVVGSLVIPNQTITDAMVNNAAAISDDKLRHKYSIDYAQNHGTAVAAQRKAVYVANAAGTMTDVLAGVTVANAGAATITVNVKKNGTNVLSSAITITSSHSAFASVVGTFSVGTYVAGDVFEVDVTVAAGGGTIGQGLFVKMLASEAAN
jgi:hypothetical protein